MREVKVRSTQQVKKIQQFHIGFHIGFVLKTDFDFFFFFNLRNSGHKNLSNYPQGSTSARAQVFPSPC